MKKLFSFDLDGTLLKVGNNKEAEHVVFGDNKVKVMESKNMISLLKIMLNDDISVINSGRPVKDVIVIGYEHAVQVKKWGEENFHKYFTQDEIDVITKNLDEKGLYSGLVGRNGTEMALYNEKEKQWDIEYISKHATIPYKYLLKTIREITKELNDTIFLANQNGENLRYGKLRTFNLTKRLLEDYIEDLALGKEKITSMLIDNTNSSKYFDIVLAAEMEIKGEGYLQTLSLKTKEEQLESLKPFIENSTATNLDELKLIASDRRINPHFPYSQKKYEKRKEELRNAENAKILKNIKSHVLKQLKEEMKDVLAVDYLPKEIYTQNNELSYNKMLKYIHENDLSVDENKIEEVKSSYNYFMEATFDKSGPIASDLQMVGKDNGVKKIKKAFEKRGVVFDESSLFHFADDLNDLRVAKIPNINFVSMSNAKGQDKKTFSQNQNGVILVTNVVGNLIDLEIKKDPEVLIIDKTEGHTKTKNGVDGREFIESILSKYNFPLDIVCTLQNTDFELREKRDENIANQSTQMMKDGAILIDVDINQKTKPYVEKYLVERLDALNSIVVDYSMNKKEDKQKNEVNDMFSNILNNDKEKQREI